jgi:serine/threonine protein kinase/DNA-binding LacI/PurR family transcriptional regulator
MPDSMIGKQIDDFIIEERLGQGAMAVVYRAFQPSINRYVALKVIRLDEGQGQHEDFRQRFAREAKVIASLEHIHILPIYAYGINPEMAYLAMRWLKGGTLSHIMRRERLSLEQSADIFTQVAKGLAYAHSQGVIHRDLKPSNIMLDDTGNAYLTDFGLAKMVESSGEITKTGNIVGTPAYMSPEQLRGEILDFRSDIYSLGVILYNLMVGRLPFDTTTTDLVSVIYQHLEKEPTPPSQLNPEISPAVELVILKALQKNREARYNSTLEMAKALNTALGRPISTDTLTDISRPRPLKNLQTRRPVSLGTRATAGLVVLVLAALTFIAILTVRSSLATQSVQETLQAAQWTPTPLPLAIILSGQSVPADQIVPNSNQIALAKSHLGQNGFIAYITCNLSSEFHAALAREIRATVTQYGLAFRVYDADNDKGNQVALVERARSEGALGILICPLNMGLLNDPFTSIQQAHFPLVLFADHVPNYGGVLIGGDNYQMGLEGGEFAGNIIHDEMKGEVDIIILDYPSLDYIVARANGLEDGVKKFAPDVHIVGRYLGAVREKAEASVAQLIQSGVKFNFILSINDQGSYGAIDAMQKAGWKCDSVSIVSIDAEALAEQYIRDGCFIRASQETTWLEPAHAMVNSMVHLLSGGTIAETVSIPPGPMITKELLAETDAIATAAALTPTTPP